VYESFLNITRALPSPPLPTTITRAIATLELNLSQMGTREIKMCCLIAGRAVRKIASPSASQQEND